MMMIQLYTCTVTVTLNDTDPSDKYVLRYPAILHTSILKYLRPLKLAVQHGDAPRLPAHGVHKRVHRFSKVRSRVSLCPNLRGLHQLLPASAPKVLKV
eukprot:2616634-Rhodomonas_salina.4